MADRHLITKSCFGINRIESTKCALVSHLIWKELCKDMAKILKQLVFGQKKNPPAPPMPDYQGEEAAKDEFADHDYENISKFTSEGRSSIRFQEPKEPEVI
ncbi:uncharacterized protein NPIL_667191 [Nephila pilipes]|uniref:Uncharacterized protein n=1 Tax=Nephila pilipes TaxID=299642 RepID=A0A8X6TNA7_NEPPI|nr:uncharacterized protein NPIL_667191 [Nephila pilipes]